MRALGFEYKPWKGRRLPHRGRDVHCRYHHSRLYDEFCASDAHRGIPESRVKFSYEVIATLTEKCWRTEKRRT